MVYLAITLLIVAGIFWLFRTLRWRSLKRGGISFGVLALLLYFFLKKLDTALASTPARYSAHNQTSKDLTAYYIVFYTDANPRVLERTSLAPNEHANATGFEIEGARKIWLVTTHESKPFSLRKITDSLAETQTIYLKESDEKFTANEEQLISAQLSKYRTRNYTNTALVVLILSTILLLHLQKKGIDNPRSNKA